jgi:hypothetical protein
MELKRKAIEEGMISLRLSGLQKLREGMTTVEEVVRRRCCREGENSMSVTIHQLLKTLVDQGGRTFTSPPTHPPRSASTER